jgi:hypothetical protein
MSTVVYVCAVQPTSCLHTPPSPRESVTALPAQLEWVGDERYRRVHKRKYVSNTVTATVHFAGQVHELCRYRARCPRPSPIRTSPTTMKVRIKHWSAVAQWHWNNRERRRRRRLRYLSCALRRLLSVVQARFPFPHLGLGCRICSRQYGDSDTILQRIERPLTSVTHICISYRVASPGMIR